MTTYAQCSRKAEELVGLSLVEIAEEILGMEEVIKALRDENADLQELVADYREERIWADA